MRRSDRKPAVSKELAGELISLANLLRRPIFDSSGSQLSRVADVVVHPAGSIVHPLVTGIIAAIGKGRALVDIRSVNLQQTGVRLSFATVLLQAPAEPPVGEALCLSRDVLDHQMVDVDGAQIVRAADVFLARTGDGWGLGGIDVGVWSFLRRLLPRRRSCPPPSRFIDWAELYALLPRLDDGHDADAANLAPRSVQLAASVKELRTLKAADVALLLQGVSRQHQAQIALALQGSPSVVAVLRELTGPKLDALLDELDSDDRSRLLALVKGEP